MRLAPARTADARGMARAMGGWVDETPWMPRIHTPAEDLNFCRTMVEQYHVTVVRNLWGTHGFLARKGEHVHALYLKPRARRRGLGTALLGRAKTECKRLELWTFQQNTAARAFYAKHGFNEVERTDGAGNDEKLPDIRLVWQRKEHDA